MERTCILACKTIERELLRAMQEAHVSLPVVWVESGLHNHPKKLRARVQEQLDAIARDGVVMEDAGAGEGAAEGVADAGGAADAADAKGVADAKGAEGTAAPLRPTRVLMAFGTCGNAFIGCRARDFELVLPRIDDCVSLMMGSRQKRQEAAGSYKAYYLTRGWMDGERNIIAEYEWTLNRYGKQRGGEIFQSLFGHYRNMAFIDTGTYDVELLKRETAGFCDAFGWGQVVLPGSLERFVELVRGPWDDESRFIVKRPGEAFTEKDMIL